MLEPLVFDLALSYFSRQDTAPFQHQISGSAGGGEPWKRIVGFRIYRSVSGGCLSGFAVRPQDSPSLFSFFMVYASFPLAGYPTIFF